MPPHVTPKVRRRRGPGGLANGTAAVTLGGGGQYSIGGGAAQSYLSFCDIRRMDRRHRPGERSEMGSKDRMYLGVALGAIALAAWLLYATRPAEEPTQQGHVSPPSAPTSGSK
jgi:hypothetical protein